MKFLKKFESFPYEWDSINDILNIAKDVDIPVSTSTDRQDLIIKLENDDSDDYLDICCDIVERIQSLSEHEIVEISIMNKPSHRFKSFWRKPQFVNPHQLNKYNKNKIEYIKIVLQHEFAANIHQHIKNNFGEKDLKIYKKLDKKYG